MPIIRSLIPLLLSLLLSGCTGLLFQPLEQHVLEPSKVNVQAEDVFFTSGDLQLHGWFLPAKGESKGLVLFLHGNAENISTHLGSVWWLPNYGFDVFLFDYRGFGRSEGTPTLEGLEQDLRSALNVAVKMPGSEKGIIVFGQSMGGATAITGMADMTVPEQVRGLVVEGAPATYRGLAREKLSSFWLTWLFQWPLALTIDDEHRPIDTIQMLHLPILIIHGGADKIIPLQHGLNLFKAANEPKTLWVVNDAEHIAAFAKEENRERFVRFLEQVLETGRFDGESG